jgi:trigger factor
MKITQNKIEKHMIYLTVEPELSDMEEYIERRRKRLLQKNNMPEFEKGNATGKVPEQHVSGNKLIEDELNEIIPVMCNEIIKEKEIRTEMQPLVKILQKDPLILEMIVPMKPVVELCDYHSMKLDPESLDIKKEEIDFIIEVLRKEFAVHRKVARTAKEEDMIVADLEGFILKTPFMSRKHTKFLINKDFTSDIPGLYKHMVGLKKGEDKEFEFKLPEDYGINGIAGKEAIFKIKVYEVYEIILPELNNDFANKVAPGVRTLDELKYRIEKNLIKERKDNAQTRFESRLIDTIIKQSKLEYPPIMVDMETEGLVDQYKQELKMSSRDNKEYEEKVKQLPDAMLKAQFRPIAEKRILWSLIIDEAAKTENIEVNDNDVGEEIEQMISSSGEDKEQQRSFLNDYPNRQNIFNIIKARKTVNKLVEIVQDNN